jgi:uncharacterized protein YkwD
VCAGMPWRASTIRKGAALAAALLFSAASPRATAAVALTPTEHSFLVAVNGVRAQHHVGPVAVEPSLVRAARAHSGAMIRTGVLAHGDFVRRLVRFGAHGPVVGENLGWTVDDPAAVRRVVSWWLGSPRHREVLLRRGFRQIGIGVALGPFGGSPRCIVVTTDFEGR